MNKLKKVFEVNTEIKNYTYPVFKIMLCLIVTLLLLNRNKIFSLEGTKVAGFVTVFATAIVIVCVYCTYISIAEVVELYDRRAQNRININTIATKQYPVETILNLIEKEDVLDVVIKVQKDIIKIGCTSDNNWSTNVFFNKIYYCNETQYESIEAFREAINTYASNEMLDVISIE